MARTGNEPARSCRTANDARMLSIDAIRHRLSDCPVRLLKTDALRHAAVALILRYGASGAEVLFIERARHEKDPWSGDLGFPGGKIEKGDDTPKRAAERETLEEIGLDLSRGDYLGQLDDIAGAHLPVVVSCFVYAVREEAPLAFSAEVVDAFWAPLETLCDPARQRLATVHFRGEPLQRPAIELRGAEGTVLWGITYRLVAQFLQILDLPYRPPRSDDGMR